MGHLGLGVGLKTSIVIDTEIETVLTVPQPRYRPSRYRSLGTVRLTVVNAVKAGDLMMFYLADPISFISKACRA